MRLAVYSKLKMSLTIFIYYLAGFFSIVLNIFSASKKKLFTHRILFPHSVYEKRIGKKPIPSSLAYGHKHKVKLAFLYIHTHMRVHTQSYNPLIRQNLINKFATLK